jgi:hypothetical protein
MTFVSKFILPFFLIILLHPLFGQNESSWQDLAEKITDPDSVTSLLINFNEESNNFAIMNKFINIKNLWLQEMQNEDVEKINSLKCPGTLIISDSPELDLDAFFENFKKCENLSYLALQGDQIDEIPEMILKFKKLERISVNDNDNIDIKSLLGYCKDLPLLTSVDLSGNRISTLPSGIPVVNNIHAISLRDNLLESTGKFINSFPGVDSLQLDGNMFASISDELIKLKNSKIKYISIDSSVVLDDRWKDIKTEYPQTVFNLVPDFPISAGIDAGNSDIPDSMSFTLKEPVDTASSDSVVIGYFKLEKNTFSILSDAYLHYPRLFPLEKYAFDSLLFEERFSDLNYINNVKKTLTFKKGRIQLSYGKVYSRIISFYIQTNQSYVNKNYNELSVYNGKTKWVYKLKDYKRGEFKKKFIGTKNHPVLWNDIKIEYDANANDYQIILKNDTALFNFDCYIKKTEMPLFNNKKKRKSEVSSVALEKVNLKKYLRYVKLRSSRESKVNKAIVKDMDLYKKTMLKYSNANWLSFQQIYMSDEEKAMTREQWLEYYEKVIANEPEAIRNRDASVDATERALDIDGYQISFSAMLIGDTLPIESCSLRFTDKEKNILAVNKIVIILPDRQTYLTTTGTMNSDYNLTILPMNERVMFVVETVSGKVGVATASETEKARSNGSTQYEIPMQMLDSKIATVGQIYNILLW